MLDFRTKWLRISIAGLGLVCTLVACDDVKKGMAGALDSTLREYSSDIHWSDFNAAYAFVDPDSKKDHPMTSLDSERYKQIEVSTYDVESRVDGVGIVDQQVRLGLINRNTQIPRDVVYHEHWRWDEAHKHWWLTTGLPDITESE